MVTPRKPDESDQDYVARIGDADRRWEQALVDADRAARELAMTAMLAQLGGFDADDLDGWQRRSAFVRGVEVGYRLATEVHGAVGSLAALHPRDFIAAMPSDLGAAFDVLDAFNAVPRDAPDAITQAEIDAVAVAAAVVAEQLRPAIEALKGS
jgi:hypothetical protein